MADGAVRSYPVSVKGIYRVYRVLRRAFAARVVGQCSENSEKPWCPRRSILLSCSDLKPSVTCWSPHASSTGGRSSLFAN